VPKFSRRFLALALLSILTLVGACKFSEGSKQLSLGNVPFNNHGTKTVTGTAELELEVDSFYFQPTFLRGAPGQLNLKVKNDSKDLHNLSVPRQQVDVDIAAKGSAEIKATFPTSGVVQFLCKYHTGRGMNGELLAGNASPQPP
jgi:plastocyanin